MQGGIDVQALLAALKGRPGGIASGGRTNPIEAIQQRASTMLADRGAVPEEMGGGPDMEGGPDEMDLLGMPDPRGMTGIMARGANVYPGGGPAQQGGGDQFGAPVGGNPMLPPRNAILRRIQAQRGNNGILS